MPARRRPACRSALALGALAAALAGCGGSEEEDAPRTACNVPRGTTETGPFCLTRSGVLEELGRTVEGLDCEPEPVRGVSRPFPRSVDRCRAGDVRFRLVLYRDGTEALYARPTLLDTLDTERLTQQVRLSQNVIAVLDRRSRAGSEVLRAVGRLGDQTR